MASQLFKIITYVMLYSYLLLPEQALCKNNQIFSASQNTAVFYLKKTILYQMITITKRLYTNFFVPSTKFPWFSAVHSATSHNNIYVKEKDKTNLIANPTFQQVLFFVNINMYVSLPLYLWYKQLYNTLKKISSLFSSKI